VEAVPSGTLTFVSHGARVAVRADDSSLLRQVETVLPPGSRLVATAGPVDAVCSIRAEPGGWRITADETVLVPTDDVGVLLRAVASALHFSVAVSAPELLFLHAGVVGWGGRAVLAPAPSGSGKTRLVMALLAAGATYYSDDYAVFDATGLVHPYPKALSVRPPGGGLPASCPAADFGAATGDEPLPVGLVLLSRYEPDAVWRPQPVPPAKAVLGLLANTVLAQRRGPAALGIWRQVAETAVTVSSRRGGAEQVVAWLRAQVDHAEGEDIRWNRAPGRAGCS
jgi:hypothetical protein